ncbi:MAG TPA: hypothetical protein DGD08_08465 [Gemmatimonas aurantiaca]|uniref:Uncharacterized protein n=2 Tax=Gemmatimonas aurantiaca TaxID=173480 RepID=C1A459_GEMAT|nr:hypothetical protein [Gemmatimonas aurantiaca]BAH38884.1 hypothetical protein GAU_1842 [Gemmatimonas aurantiaca T-27]HCT57231.1 hypothetical protein [Gemmatimonas aurantiaca]
MSDLSIDITSGQAQLVARGLQAVAMEQKKLAVLLDILTAGRLPDGATLQSVDCDTNTLRYTVPDGD